MMCGTHTTERSKIHSRLPQTANIDRARSILMTIDDKQPIQPVRRKMLLGQEENG